MMSLSDRIARRIREVYLNGHWVAKTNYVEALEEIDLAKASKKIGTHNTIAILVYHVNYYLDGLNKVFQGGDLTIKDKYSFEMPVLSNESEWQQLKVTLFNNAEQFATLVEEMDDEVLHGPFVKQEYGSNLRNVEATIEHGYYHLGQIVLLQKLIHANQG